MLFLLGTSAAVAIGAVAVSAWQARRISELDLRLFEAGEHIKNVEKNAEQKMKIVQNENRLLEMENTSLKNAIPKNKLDKVLEIMGDDDSQDS